jgi:hypothetical protein
MPCPEKKKKFASEKQRKYYHASEGYKRPPKKGKRK